MDIKIEIENRLKPREIMEDIEKFKEKQRQEERAKDKRIDNFFKLFVDKPHIISWNLAIYSLKLVGETDKKDFLRIILWSMILYPTAALSLLLFGVFYLLDQLIIFIRKRIKFVRHN